MASKKSVAKKSSKVTKVTAVVPDGWAAMQAVLDEQEKRISKLGETVDMLVRALCTEGRRKVILSQIAAAGQNRKSK